MRELGGNLQFSNAKYGLGRAGIGSCKNLWVYRALKDPDGQGTPSAMRFQVAEEVSSGSDGLKAWWPLQRIDETFTEPELCVHTYKLGPLLGHYGHQTLWPWPQQVLH